MKGHRVDSVVLLQRGWWVGTKNNRGATNAVLCERRALYILDDSKRFAMPKTTVSNEPNPAEGETAGERLSLSLSETVLYDLSSQVLPHSDKVRIDFFHMEKTYIQDTHTPTREEGRQVNVFLGSCG
jgi:hypothetical protein